MENEGCQESTGMSDEIEDDLDENYSDGQQSRSSMSGRFELKGLNEVTQKAGGYQTDGCQGYGDRVESCIDGVVTTETVG